MKTSSLVTWVTALAAALLPATHANAGLLTVDIYNGASHLIVTDGSAADIDPSPDSIIVKSSVLLASFGTQIISGSAVSASSNLASALISGLSNLSTSYILKTKSGVTSDFTIIASQSGFLLPGNAKELDVSASFTFTKSGTLGSGTFQGSVGTTNGASNVFDSTISAVSLNNLPNSYFGSGAGAQFISNSFYSMQNVLTAHLVSTTNAAVQGQGTSVVTYQPSIDSLPAPEPSSIVIFGAMFGPVAYGLRRRKSSAA